MIEGIKPRDAKGTDLKPAHGDVQAGQRAAVACPSRDPGARSTADARQAKAQEKTAEYRTCR
jgi:hypothetical protein